MEVKEVRRDTTLHSLCLRFAFGFLKCCLGIVREPQTRTMKWHKKTVKKRNRRGRRTARRRRRRRRIGKQHKINVINFKHRDDKLLWDSGSKCCQCQRAQQSPAGASNLLYLPLSLPPSLSPSLCLPSLSHPALSRVQLNILTICLRLHFSPAFLCHHFCHTCVYVCVCIGVHVYMCVCVRLSVWHFYLFGRTLRCRCLILSFSFSKLI